MKNNSSPYAIALVCMAIIFGHIACAAQPEVIAELSGKIAAATSETEKGRLYIYRARNFIQIGDTGRAMDDYDSALAFNHKGWVHLERARFFMTQKNYEQAIREAVAAQEETPTLETQSRAIIAQAGTAFKKKLREENPEEILLTTKWQTRTITTPQLPSRRNPGGREAYAATSKTTASSTTSLSRS